MARHVLTRTLCLFASALVTPMLVAGCGGEDKAEAKSPAEVMQTARQNFDEASSVHIVLSTESTPDSGNGVLGATGDVTHDPAFAGDVKVLLRGLTATVPVTSVGGKVYAKLPLAPRYAVIDPTEYGAPDPAQFADPQDGFSGLLAEVEGLEKGKESRAGDQILTSYTGSLPGAAVQKIIPSADADETFETEIGVRADGYLSTVEVTGPFFGGGEDVTYDVKFSEYDKGVEITAPET
jgi:lipoprotein LprG